MQLVSGRYLILIVLPGAEIAVTVRTHVIRINV
jgi:hypothetical protein